MTTTSTVMMLLYELSYNTLDRQRFNVSQLWHKQIAQETSKIEMFIACSKVQGQRKAIFVGQSEYIILLLLAIYLPVLLLYSTSSWSLNLQNIQKTVRQKYQVRRNYRRNLGFVITY